MLREKSKTLLWMKWYLQLFTSHHVRSFIVKSILGENSSLWCTYNLHWCRLSKAFLDWQRMLLRQQNLPYRTFEKKILLLEPPLDESNLKNLVNPLQSRREWNFPKYFMVPHSICCPLNAWWKYCRWFSAIDTKLLDRLYPFQSPKGLN